MQPVPAWILSLAALMQPPAGVAPAAPRATFACSLQAGPRDAQVEALRALRAHSRTVTELPDGYAFVFPDDAGVAALLQVILAERRCCPFFRFELILDPDLGPVTLRARGPAGAKPFIRELLGAEEPAR